MEPSRRPDPRDPEFDPAPARPVRLADLDPAEHRRVVVNPFLAVLEVIAAWAAAGWFAARRPAGVAAACLAVLGAITLFGVPWLVQFHCLDCGRTRAYPRLRDHACPGILARMREDRPARTILPRPTTQLLVWGYLIAAATLILAVSGLSGR